MDLGLHLHLCEMGPTFHGRGDHMSRPFTSDDSIASFGRWMKRHAAGKSLSRVLADDGLEQSG